MGDNKVPACKGCPYNTPKSKRGFGYECNGSTQEEHGRCPEWRINELLLDDGALSDLIGEATEKGLTQESKTK